jgi:hypothetical protein
MLNENTLLSVVVEENAASWSISFRYKSTDLVLLYVAVPPRWTVEPTDANVASGLDVTLHCQADGYPVPSVTWRKAVGILPLILSDVNV